MVWRGVCDTFGLDRRLESALWAVCEVCRVAVPFASDEFETEWLLGAVVDERYVLARVGDEAMVEERLGWIDDDERELICGGCLGTRLLAVGEVAERRDFRTWYRERLDPPE